MSRVEVVISLIVALLAAGWFGVAVVRDVLADRRPLFPAHIETLLPLKGRWLRLLLFVFPATAGMLASSFVGVLGLLMAARFVVSILGW